MRRASSRSKYAQAGVDLDKVASIHSFLSSALAKTFTYRRGKVGSVLSDIGHYAGLVDIGGGSALALHVDGVGSKLLIAQMMGKYDTVGIDCIAMCVNDLICVGAEPIAMVDYLALKKPNPRLVRQLVRGLVKGASEASVALVGGETAILPDMLSAMCAFDLAGMAVGLVDQGSMLIQPKLGEGDILIGVRSSGLHSNGYTLARKVLLKNHELEDYIQEMGRTLGEELLEPTLIYVKPTLEALKHSSMHGISHITGGAFTKLKRLLVDKRLQIRVDSPPEPPEIFKMIQREGRVQLSEMYRTFNMGIGLAIAAPNSDADQIVSIYERNGFDAMVIGRVVRGLGVRVQRFSLA